MYMLEVRMPDMYGQNRNAPRMLVVDDDPSILKLLEDRCRKVGFEIETGINGVQALIKIRRNHPDILIIDVNMPEADGLSVCAHVLDSSRKDLNVIVVTGGRDPETLERCEGFGAFYVRKGPEFWRELASALAELFPEMAHRIKELEVRSVGNEIRKRPRVLLIDDDADVEAFLSSRLSKYGVDLLYASDAVQGYRMACREQPSVIICDNFMPNGDASYLLGRLRTTAATELTPVIVLSGKELDEMTRKGLMREVCGRPGATRVLVKSFDTSELFGSLREFCGFEEEAEGAAAVTG
jgi:CheY-like chemotaxis protein